VTQASVMAHVVGHCEFSERNVLRDSNDNRTEYVMYLVRKVDRARQQMEAGLPRVLERGRVGDDAHGPELPVQRGPLRRVESTIGADYKVPTKEMERSAKGQGYRSGVRHADGASQGASEPSAFEAELEKTPGRDLEPQRLRPQSALSGRSRLPPPPRCREPGRALDPRLQVRDQAPQDFVMRTQIMNEGWAMYWEKKIMLELFKEAIGQRHHRLRPGVLERLPARPTSSATPITSATTSGATSSSSIGMEG
jgi:stage V sporulation protein R